MAGRAQDVTGGFVDIGRRQYMMTFEGEFSPEQLEDQILDWRDGRPVLLGDIAQVSVRRADRFAIVYQNGNPALGLRLFRTNGANVLTTIDAVKEVVEELNEGVLVQRGLHMEHSYDPSVFIKRAISLLTTNLAIGILLAIGALWMFLRNVRATMIIALTIPISLFATLSVLQLTGRSLNVISLAGLAFGVGMVLDAAIVVLKAIVREHGLGVFEASQVGASRVWNALLTSTATTVAVFLPVMFLADAEGQLFSDLALTIAIAVTASLLVAIMVLPTAAGHFLKDLKSTNESHKIWNGLANVLMNMTATPRARWMWVVLLTVAPVAASVTLAPALGYLPQVRRDAVDAFIQLPPGSNLDSIDEEILQPIVERLVEPGEYASVGTVVARLVDTENLEVTAQVPVSIAAFLRGATTLSVGLGNDVVVQCDIRTVIPVGDQITRTFEIRVTLPENNGIIGTPVRVAVPSDVPRQVVAVPRDAIFFRADGSYVFRVSEDNVAERLLVESGVTHGGRVEVRGALVAGDQIVICGGERLQDGQAVTIAEAS